VLVPNEQTMDVPKEQEQAEQAKPSERLTTAKVKDPKKQEAGHKDAAARRQKLEVLTADLAAAKEAVFSCKSTNNEEHAVDTKASKTHVSSEPKTTEGSSGEGWSVGIGSCSCSLRGIVCGESVFTANGQASAEQFVQQTSTTCSRSMFDME